MRAHGTLVRWNDERGFGFIAPAGGGDELFVHVSAFPRDARRPTVGEAISFEVEVAPDGKRRAVNVWRPDARRPAAGERSRRTPAASRSGGRPRPALVTIAVLLLGVLAAGAFAHYRGVLPGAPAAPSAPAASLPQPITAPPLFRCDGRRHCSQMRSCEEARFFLANCPNTEMDGDHDGEPCEQQWCE